MALEILSELETKINSLVDTVTYLKKENEINSEEMRIKDQKLKEFEKERGSVQDTIDSFKKESEVKQKKLDTAADRIRGLISKLDAVE